MREKRFEEIMRQNGIRFPVFFKERFLERWTPVAIQYKKYCIARKEEIENWEKERKEFLKNWSFELPELDKKFPRFKFKTPEEAQQVISMEFDKLENTISRYKEEKINTEQELKEDWIQEVVALAPSDCKLIVIKGNYIPEKYRELFEKEVKTGRSVRLYFSWAPVWIAFRPSEPINTYYWLVKKNTSTVEYLCK